MSRKTKEIISDLRNILKEAVQAHDSIEKGDFVHYQHPTKGEWHVEAIDGDHAVITDPDGQEMTVPLSTLSVAQKKLTDADFHDMPMENSLDAFDDEIEPMPLDQIKDMPAIDKGLLSDPDLDAIAGDVNVDIDSDIYQNSIEDNPDRAGSYFDDEAQDAGYPFPSFAGGLREFFNLKKKLGLKIGDSVWVDKSKTLIGKVRSIDAENKKAMIDFWNSKIASAEEVELPFSQIKLTESHILKESCEKKTLSENANYHIKNNIPLSENVFRYGSKAYGEVWGEFRNLWENDEITLTNSVDVWLMENTELGRRELYKGTIVPLDMPMLETEYKGKEVKLNKPKRGGSKKFYVYTKNDKGNVIKVSFGAKSGGQSLSVKIKDPEARKNFASRHNCDIKKDKTKAGYWSCNLPRYAKALGMGDNMNTYW